MNDGMGSVERREVWRSGRITVTEALIRACGASAVLEIGAGDHSFAPDVGAGVARWTRVDFAPPCDVICNLNDDRSSLPFREGSFDLVVCTEVVEHLLWPQQLVGEVHRVLAPGGRLLIWDVVFPRIEDKKKTIALFPFTFKLPGKTINTGYGVHIPAGEQGLAHYEELAAKTGFKVASKSTEAQRFFLELVKAPTPAEK